MKLNNTAESLIRLNRFIANSGICTRREADKLITEGLISVNNEVVQTLGTKITPGKDRVIYDGKVLSGGSTCYVLLNKPKGLVTEGKGKKNVYPLMGGCCHNKVYPVSPLEEGDCGLQLFTSDLDIRASLNSSVRLESLYHVKLTKAATQAQLDALVEGIEGKSGLIQAIEAVHVAGKEDKEIGVRVRGGINIHGLLRIADLTAAACDRVSFGGITKKALPRGNWRHLKPKEVGFIQMARSA